MGIPQRPGTFREAARRKAGDARGKRTSSMSSAPSSTPGPGRPRPPVDVDALVAGVRRGDRAALGRAITLVESASSRHESTAQSMLQRLLGETGRARRIGITGVPGVGKSTFIEALGCHLCGLGRRVAVLAIDPSSVLSRGSILGDKTRMERLSREPNAFIRPSPAGESLGGVARRTRETMLLCEAAGYDVVLVETVGVGQSEVSLRSMVDFFLLLLLPGAGDDLQGIKRGIMEMADAVLVNKADGPLQDRAEAARAEQASALRYLQPISPGWTTEVGTCSASTGRGIAEFWSVVERFFARPGGASEIESRRRVQGRDWMHALVREELWDLSQRQPAVAGRVPELEGAVARGEVTAVQAARELLQTFQEARSPRNAGTDLAEQPGSRHADPN